VVAKAVLVEEKVKEVAKAASHGCYDVPDLQAASGDDDKYSSNLMKEVRSIEDDINDQLFAAENDAAGTVGASGDDCWRGVLYCNPASTWQQLRASMLAHIMLLVGC
jgi:hypothetical protein